MDDGRAGDGAAGDGGQGQAQAAASQVTDDHADAGDAGHFGQHAGNIGRIEVVQEERADGDIDGLVGQRERCGEHIGAEPLGGDARGGGAACGDGQRGVADINADEAGAGRGGQARAAEGDEQVAAAGGDIEHAGRCGRDGGAGEEGAGLADDGASGGGEDVEPLEAGECELMLCRREARIVHEFGGTHTSFHGTLPRGEDGWSGAAGGW